MFADMNNTVCVLIVSRPLRYNWSICCTVVAIELRILFITVADHLCALKGGGIGDRPLSEI